MTDPLTTTMAGPLPGDLATTIDRAARAFIGDATPGIGIGVAMGDRTWASGWGVADDTTGRPAGPGTRFRIASITKTFTATVILQLRDEGKLGLDDPLVTHLPDAARIAELAGRHEQVTIGRLLLHTAGLQGAAPPADPGRRDEPRPDAILARLGEVAIVRPPGDRWAYSNLGYELLAIVAERLAGVPYEALLERAVTAPAGLVSTSFAPSPEDAIGHLDPHPGRTARVAPSHDELAHRGDGGLWSSAADLARWLALQRFVADTDRRGDGERILDGRSLRSMHRPLAFVDDAWTLAQGLGWAMERFDGATWVRHTGSMHGFRSIALVRPSDGVGVAVLANGTVRPNELARTIARALLAARREGAVDGGMRGAPHGAPAPDEAPAGRYAALAGRWADPLMGLWAETRTADGGLVLREAPDAAWRPLIAAAAPDSWRIGGDDERSGELVRFIRDADGTVRDMNVAGYPLARVPATR